jgi:hypothetical protein
MRVMGVYSLDPHVLSSNEISVSCLMTFIHSRSSMPSRAEQRGRPLARFGGRTMISTEESTLHRHTPRVATE